MSTTELATVNTRTAEVIELGPLAGKRLVLMDEGPIDTAATPNVTKQLSALGGRLTEILGEAHKLRFTRFGTLRCESCNSPYCDLA